MKRNGLTELRKQKGYSLEDMAALLGYAGKSGYWQLENGVVHATVTQARDIAKALEVSSSVVVDMLAAARAKHEMGKAQSELAATAQSAD